MHLKLMFVRLCEIFHELFGACRKTLNKTSLFTCAIQMFRDPSFFSFSFICISLFLFFQSMILKVLPTCLCEDVYDVTEKIEFPSPLAMKI